MADIDEFHGIGGSYEIDPTTGKRILKERTVDPTENAPIREAGELPAPQSTSKKK